MTTMTVPVVPRADLISSVELCARAGITYRMLDYWTRHSYLAPVVPANGSGPFACALARLSGWLSSPDGQAKGPLRMFVQPIRESLATGEPVEPIPGVVIDASRLASPK